MRASDFLAYQRGSGPRSTRSATDIGSLAWGPNGELISPFGRLGIAYYANPTGYENPNEAAFIPATTAQTLQFQLMGK